VALALATALAVEARTVRADAGPSSTGIDADTLWLPPSQSRLVSLPSSEWLAPGSLSLGVGTTWLSRPVVVTAPSGDPSGRTIPVVEHALDTTLLAAIGVGLGSELTLAMPFTVLQSGAGAGALSDQRAPGLARRAVRDPRIGWSLATRRFAGYSTWGVRTGLELGLPLGTDHALSGDRGLVLVPGIVGDLQLGRLYVAAELGARLREPTELADAIVGSQLVGALGVSFDLLPPRLLGVGLEVRALPSLVTERVRLPDGSPGPELVLVPAEWMASLTLSPVAGGALSFQLGAGGGLPLSTVRQADGNEHRASGVTTPDARLLAGVRGVFGLASSGRARAQKIRSDT
jgi:hypothetical protein